MLETTTPGAGDAGGSVHRCGLAARTRNLPETLSTVTVRDDDPGKAIVRRFEIMNHLLDALDAHTGDRHGIELVIRLRLQLIGLSGAFRDYLAAEESGDG